MIDFDAVKRITTGGKAGAMSYDAPDSIAADEKTGIWKYLSYLDRPMQTVLNPLHALVSQKDERGIVESALQGLTGQTEVRLSDVLREGGVPELGTVNLPLLGDVTGRGALGLAGEIFTDPLNLIGGGLTKAGRLAKTDDLARLFKTGLPEGASLGKTLLEQGQLGQRAALGYRLPFNPDVRSVLPDFLNNILLKQADVAGEAIKRTLPYKWLAKPYHDDPLAAAVEIFGNSGAKYFQNELLRESIPLVQYRDKLEKLFDGSNASAILNDGSVITFPAKQLKDNSFMATIGKRGATSIRQIPKMTWQELGPTVMNIAEQGYDPARLARLGLISDPAIAEQLVPLADGMVNFNRGVFDKLVKAGADPAKLDPSYGLNYMKHVAQEGQDLPERLKGAARMWSTTGTKSREFHWSFSLGSDPKIYKNPEAIKSGYIFENDMFYRAKNADDVEKALRRGAEFRLSDREAKDIFGKTRKDYLKTGGAERGASSIAEQNILADLKAKTPEGIQSVRLVDDPFASIAATIYKSGRQAATAKMGSQIARNADWALDASAAPAGWIKMDKSFGKDLAGMMVRPDIYKHITRDFNPRKLNKDVGEFIEKLGKGQGWWKAFTLAVPATTSRNIFSNFIMGAWGGNLDIKAHYNGLKFIMAGMYKEKLPVAELHKAFNKVPIFNTDNFMRGSIVKGYSNEKLWRLARELGVIDNDLLGRAGNVAELAGDMGGRTVSSIENQLYSFAGKGPKAIKKYNPVSVEGPIIRNAKVINAGVEGQARMALWLDGLNKGMSPQESALNVYKWMLDYTPESLSPVERDIFAQIIPFYKFMRRNTANMIDMFFTDPAKLMRTARPFVQAQPKISQDELDIMPSWWKEGMPLKLSDDPETGLPRYADLRNYVPFGGVSETLESGGDPVKLLRSLVGGISPLVKLPLEVGSNISSFSGKPIERFPGEPAEYLGLPTTKMYQHIARSIFRPGKELDVLNPGDVFGDDRMGRWKQPGQDDRIIAAVTGFRSMILDEAKRRIQMKYEKSKAVSHLRTAERQGLQTLMLPRVQNNPALRVAYQYSLDRIRNKLRDLGYDPYAEEGEE